MVRATLISTRTAVLVKPSSIASHALPIIPPPANQLCVFFPLPDLFLTSHMSDQSGPFYFHKLCETAFQDYKKQMGKNLANHPLAKKLQSCDSVKSITALLHEQTETFSKIQGKDKVLKPLKSILSVLDKLSSASDVRLVRP
jgi:hypothetical protein